MTTQDQIYKWLWYALGLVPVWIAETMILNRVPLLGVIPVLLPLAAVAAALWEGASAGAVFGLCVGVLADAVYPGAPGGMTLGLCALGWLTGAVSQYALKQNYLGYLLCCAIDLGVIELFRLLWCLLTRLGPLEAVAWVALKEALWSLCFTPFIYLLYRLIYRKVGGERLGG